MLDLAKKLIDWLGASPVAQATSLSMLLAVLRVAFDSKETTWTRITIEAAICGTLTMMMGKGTTALGASVEWAFLFGGFSAFIGVAAFRKMLIEGAWIKIKGDKPND